MSPNHQVNRLAATTARDNRRPYRQVRSNAWFGGDVFSSLRDNLGELEKIAPRIAEKGESAADDGEVEWFGNDRDSTAT